MPILQISLDIRHQTMSISHYVPHLKSPLLVVAFSPTAVLKVLPAFDPCRDTLSFNKLLGRDFWRDPP